MSAPELSVRIQARSPESLEPVSVRIARNTAWLLCSDGITKGLFFAANIVLARILSASDYGTLALAQSWVMYAAILSDMGVMMYGQAETARSGDRERTTILAWEILPLRALLGILVFIALLALLPLFTSSGQLRVTIWAASVYLLGQAVSLEWLFRGKERFDIVLLGNAAGNGLFLAAILAIAALGSDALIKAALAWSLAPFAMAAVYLVSLRKLVGSPRGLCLSTAAWRRHARESSFFALSNIIAESYRVLPFFLLGYLASKHEVGLFAAPLRLVVNVASLGFVIPMAFYPASARLFREHPVVFAHSRRALVMTMLAIGVPLAVIGVRMATPLMTLIFGESYLEGAKILALLIWLLPLYFVRYVYGTTILATGFQRLHSMATAAAGTVALLSSIPLVRSFGGTGAALSIIMSEITMAAAMIAISARVHREAAIPETSKLIKLGVLMTVVWLCGSLSETAGPLPSALLMIATYVIGLSALRLADLQEVTQRLLSSGLLRVRASSSN